MGIMPNLRVLALDPVHLAINYEYSFYGKKTDGSRDLRKLLRKFNAGRADLSAEFWGPPYTGEEKEQPDAYMLSLQEMILKHNMPLPQVHVLFLTQVAMARLYAYTTRSYGHADLCEMTHVPPFGDMRAVQMSRRKRFCAGWMWTSRGFMLGNLCKRSPLSVRFTALNWGAGRTSLVNR